MEPNTNQTQNPAVNQWIVPVAIVIAGALIAASLYFSRTDRPADSNPQADATNKAAEQAVVIKDDDHVRGERNADVRIIEYSDMECPYCKQFHATMRQISAEYSGRLAWVYRHFPIQNIHPKAVREAIASECIAELGNEDKFWNFLDKFYEVTPSNNETDLSILPTIAKGLGIKETDFNTCLDSGKYDVRINSQFNEGIATGGTGTPWSLVVTKSGRILSINGAQDYAVVKQIIETALND
jgi:protein-disulfide isomerase